MIYIFWQILVFGIPEVIFGTSIVRFLSDEYLYLILGLVSIFLAIYSFFKRDFGLISIKRKLEFWTKLRFIIQIFFIGVLNGSISSGTCLLVTILLIKTFGMDFLRAISMTFLTVGIFWNALGAIILAKIYEVPLNF